ncbi:N-acetylglutamate synthase, GNAT family [Burkholderia sp. D7]|nr:N-acetylglutamate synthase, GNAT family [Burkholderia sp. D7]
MDGTSLNWAKRTFECPTESLAERPLMAGICRMASHGMDALGYYLGMEYSGKIRRARGSDADTLTALMRSSSAYVGRYAQMLALYEVTPTQIARDEIFVVVHDHLVLGFYSLLPGPEAELDLLFVSDAAQGKSVGKLLFEHMCDRAQMIGATRVLIVSHPSSVGFYQRMGAKISGTKAPSLVVPWERPVLHMWL